jgi:two-component system, sensor histidine kinase
MSEYKPRVLVVEDQPAQIKLLTTMLRVLGFESQGARTASEAMVLLEAYRPQIVLLDIGLPDVNGFELAGMIRAVPEFAGVPIIAVTGYGYESDREKSRLSGIDHHLLKPVTIDELTICMAKVVVSP